MRKGEIASKLKSFVNKENEKTKRDEVHLELKMKMTTTQFSSF